MNSLWFRFLKSIAICLDWLLLEFFGGLGIYCAFSLCVTLKIIR